MHVAFALAVFTFAANAEAGEVIVNCDRGQSLNQALSGLLKSAPQSVVVVNGTCTEYVTIQGFESLTLKSTSGAVLRQPPFVPPLASGVLAIGASRSVTVDGLTIRTTIDDGNVPGVWVHDSSGHLRLTNLQVLGAGPGIYVSDQSEVSMVNLTVRSSGWGAIGIWHSKVSIEDSILQNPTRDYQAGIAVGQNAVLLIHGTAIQDMWEGITVSDGAMMILQDVNDEVPFGGPSDVVIDDSSGTALWGLALRNGGTALLSAKLRILNTGVASDGETGGVEVDGASSLSGGKNLQVLDSRGQGVFVKNNSHASLAGVQITGTAHTAVAAVNHASVDLGDASVGPPASIAGSGGDDLFCDPTSLITGAANAPGVTKIECNALVAAPHPPLP